MSAEDKQPLSEAVSQVTEATEEERETVQQRNMKRTENFRKLFDRLKGKFIELFEDVEDKPIE